MAKVRTLSRQFMKGHPREGEETFFVERFLTSIGIDYESQDFLQWLVDHNPKMTGEEIISFYNSLEPDVDPKHHTIRGKRHFRDGDKISIRCWSKSPYNYARDGSKQMVLADDLEVKTLSLTISPSKRSVYVNTSLMGMPTGWAMGNDKIEQLAKNDGLDVVDFWHWFKKSKDGSECQIIFWNHKIKY